MNTRFLTHRISAVALMLTAGSALVAQSSTGALVGSVKDKAGRPIAGARVTLNSTALFAPRVATTDANGEWRAPLLPVGNYDVSVAKEGFVGSGAQKVRVGLGTTVRQELTMKAIETAGAVVEVVSSAAAGVDKADTKSGTNVSAETLASLPAADRGFAGAADLSPGLVAGTGGSYSIRGGATQNTQYRVNGTDVKDDYQGNLTGNFMIEDNVEDMQVVLSPLNARNGRATGGAINVVTKTGSNEFHGSVRANLSRNSWTALNPGQVFYGPDGTNYVDDTLNKNYQVTLSGPIWKDRIWFSLGTILSPESSVNGTLAYPFANGNMAVETRSASANTILHDGPGVNDYRWTAFDSGANYMRKDKRSYLEGKITGAITADHTLEFSYSAEKVDLYNRNPYGDGGGTILRLAALGHQNTEKKVYGLGYRGVLSPTTFLEARINKLDSATYFPAGDLTYGQGELLIVYAGQWGPNYAGVRRGLGYPFGLGQPAHPDRRPNRSGNINLKMFRDLAGNHEIDLGVDYYEGQRSTATESGPTNRTFRVGGAYAALDSANPVQYLFPTVNFTGYGSAYAQDVTGLRGPAASYVQYTSHDGLTKNRMLSLYANDQWTINSHFNLMVGVRYDKMKVIDTTGEQRANTGDMSPRLQFRYDPTGDSKHLFTLTAARYNGDFTTGFTDSFITQGTTANIGYGWMGIGNQIGTTPGSATDPAGMRGVRFVTYAQLTDPQYYTRIINAGNGRLTTIVDPNLKAPHLDEVTLGYRRSWANGSNVSLTYVHRIWKKDWAFKTDYAASEAVTILTLPPNALYPNGQPLQNMKTYVFNSDEMKREYNGLEMEWTSRINSIWTIGGNWTYSHLVGNSEGGDAFGSTFRDNTPPSMYNNRIAMVNNGMTPDEIAPLGLLNNSVSTRARLHVTAMLPLGKGNISYSAMLRYSSGRPFSQVTGEVYQPGTFTPLTNPSQQPPQQYTAFVGGRGQWAGNDTYSVDFKINYNVPLGIKKLMLIGDFTVSNVFNSMLVGGLEQASWPTATLYYPTALRKRSVIINDAGTFGTPTTRDSYNEVRPDNNLYTTPRTVGMSIGLRF